MNKSKIIDKLKGFDNLSIDEKTYLISLINKNKKYGLVWENKKEDVDEKLKSTLPILKEIRELSINSENNESPNHILIEGDNLHGLTSLVFTHENKIDAIYLDPPYNTGSKDWKYNNHYVEKEDSFRHSKWISMMFKRLEIAKKLLKDDGLICVTIDDYEVSRLTMILEEIFGFDNHLGTLVIRNNPSGRSTIKGVSITHEYCIIFGKSSSSIVGRLPRNEKQRSRYKFEDKKGPFEWVNFRKHGGTRKESPSMFYPIFISEKNLRIPKMSWDENKKEWTLKESATQKETISYPIDSNGKERRWKWGIDRIKDNLEEFSIKKDKLGQFAVYVKARMNISGVLPQTWWDEKKYSATAYGTNLVKDIFGGELQVFSYPKSLYAVMDTLKVLSENKEAVILDAFAGSGTTLHAAMQLNAEDEGRRQCILITNNENNICKEVTYERNKRVIQGYTDSKGNSIHGLTNNNLRYYQCDFAERLPSLANKKELTKLATEMLCIKENCYKDITSSLLKAKWHKLFSDVSNNYVYVIYDEFYIEEAIEALTTFIENNGKDLILKVYVFSNGQYAYAEEFENIAANITLAALPDAIYKAYQNVLPKEDKENTPTLENDFNQEIAN